MVNKKMLIGGYRKRDVILKSSLIKDIQYLLQKNNGKKIPSATFLFFFITEVSHMGTLNSCLTICFPCSVSYPVYTEN